MDRVFENPREVAAFVIDKGYKVSERTVYRHLKEIGKCPPDVGNERYSMKAVLKYAKTFLKPTGTLKKKKAGELQEKKLKLEIEMQEEDLAIKRFKRLKDEEKVIDKNLSELESAAKIGRYEAALKGMVQVRAGDYVLLVNGDEQKTPDLVRALTEDIDQTGNDLASTKKFEAGFE
jgi:uncharacterized protein YaaR (DUF327 family)